MDKCHINLESIIIFSLYFIIIVVIVVLVGWIYIRKFMNTHPDLVSNIKTLITEIKENIIKATTIFNNMENISKDIFTSLADI